MTENVSVGLCMLLAAQHRKTVPKSYMVGLCPSISSIFFIFMLIVIEELCRQPVSSLSSVLCNTGEKICHKFSS